MIRIRALIAEDEGLIAEELRDRLERMGATVVGIAHSGEQAIALARKTLPNLVLMDIRLKGSTDGIEAAAAIRTHLDAAILYISALSDDATLARAEHTDPMGYLIKPIDERQLRTMLTLGLRRHRAERLLYAQARQHLVMLTSISEGVIATDATGCVTFLNAAAESVTGWRHQDATGVPIDRVLRFANTDLDGPEHPVLVTLQFATPDRFALGRRLIDSRGTEVAVDLGVAPILDAGQRVSGAVAVFRELATDNHPEERPQRPAPAHESRTLEAVGRLAGGVAHNLNNMMTVIIGYGGILLDETPEHDPHHTAIRDMKEAGDRAAALTRQLLAVGRRQLMSTAAVDPNDLLRAARERLRTVIDERVTMVLDLQREVGRIRVDPAQIEQALVDLALHALDAMPHGGTLTMATSRVRLDPRFLTEAASGGDAYVMLTVSDTGATMDEDTKARLFEPFFTSKPSGPGVELGLAAAYGIVAQSGGHIRVNTSREVGTSIEVLFPECDPRL